MIAFLYNSSYKKAFSYQNKDTSILIKFEDLILRNERIVKQLCSFLEINFNEDISYYILVLIILTLFLISVNFNLKKIWNSQKY